MKPNALAPAIAVVGDLGRELKWSHITSLKDADYVLVVLAPAPKPLPMEKLVEALEGEGARIGYLMKSPSLSIPPVGGALVRRDLYEEANFGIEPDFDSMVRAWVLSGSSVRLAKFDWREPKPFEAKSDLNQLATELDASKKTLAWIKKNGSEDDTAEYLAHVAHCVLAPYFYAIESEPVLYFGKLKLQLLESKLQPAAQEPDVLNDVIRAVMSGSRAESLRFLRLL